MCKALQSRYPFNPDRGLSAEQSLCRWENSLTLTVQSHELPSDPALAPNVLQSHNSSFPFVLLLLISFCTAFSLVSQACVHRCCVRAQISHAVLRKTFSLLPLPTLRLEHCNWMKPFPQYPLLKIIPFPDGSSVPQTGFQKSLSTTAANTPPRLAWIPGMTGVNVHMGVPLHLTGSTESGKENTWGDMNMVS